MRRVLGELSAPLLAYPRVGYTVVGSSHNVGAETGFFLAAWRTPLAPLPRSEATVAAITRVAGWASLQLRVPCSSPENNPQFLEQSAGRLPTRP